MAEVQYPKDENLRLIMSGDQEQWINGQIRESKFFVMAMAVLLGLTVAWVTVDLAVGGFSRYDQPDCYFLSGDGSDTQVMRRELLDMGLKPCPPEQRHGRGIDWTNIWAVVTLGAALLIVVSALTLLRHLFLLRKYRGYLADHQAFLAKYNRQ